MKTVMSAGKTAIKRIQLDEKGLKGPRDKEAIKLARALSESRYML